MNRPYQIQENRIRKSPFRNAREVMDAIDNHKRGVPIGFTRTASLKSMGLIPRSDGTYKLGSKYQSSS